MRGIDGHCVLVTGATGYLGKAIVKRLSEEGASIWAASRDLDKATEFVSSMGIEKVYPCKLDLSDKSSIDEAFKMFHAQDKMPDILVANASLRDGLETDMSDLDYKNFANLFSVDVGGHFLCAQAMSSYRCTSIVFVSSVYAINGVDMSIYFEGIAPAPLQYSTVKSGMLAMTKYLAARWGKHNIRVNAVVAGGIENNHPKEFIDNYSKKTMLDRMGKPDEIASSIAFLVSEDASYITGECLVVDGGFSAW